MPASPNSNPMFQEQDCMMFNKVSLLLLTQIFFSPFLFSALHAQPNTFPFTEIELQGGLESLYIDEVFQDSVGFIWFTGSDGPVRFDGHHYRQYTPAQTDSTFKSFFVRSIEEDNEGKLWFGYDGEAKISYYDHGQDSLHTLAVPFGNRFSQQFSMTELMGVDHHNRLWFYLIDLNQFHQPIVSYYDQEQNAFHFYADSSGRSTIPIERISPAVFGSHFYRAFAIDHNNDIWIGSSSPQRGGMVRLSADTVHTVFTAENSVMARHEVSDIEIGPDSTLWISTYDGIYFKPENSTSFSLLEGTEKMGFYGIYPDREGNIWMTSRYKTLRYNGVELEEISPEEIVDELERVHLYPIAETDSTLWFINSNVVGRTAESRGLTVMNKHTGIYHSLFSSRTNPHSISGNLRIREVYASRDGSVWVTHADHGLDHYHPKKKTFQTAFLNPEFQRLLADYRITEVDVSPQNIVWAGTENGHVLLLDPETGEEHHFKKPTVAKEGLRTERNIIGAFAWPKPGVVYIGSEWGALQRFTYDTETYHITDSTTWVPSAPSNPNRLPGGAVVSLQLDDNGRLWVGSTSGVGIYRPGPDNFDNIYLADTADYHPKHTFGSEVTEDENHLWYFGEQYSGVRRVNKTSGEVEFFNRTPETGDIIESVNDLLITSDQKVFLSRERDGLYVFDEDSLLFTRVNPDEIGFVYGLSERDDGNIVIGSDNGLIVMRPDGTIIDRLTRADGLFHDAVIYAFSDERERYWMQTNTGVQLFTQDRRTRVLFDEDDGLAGAIGDYPKDIYHLPGGAAGFTWFNSFLGYLNPGKFTLYKNDHTLHLTKISSSSGIHAVSPDAPASFSNDERNFRFEVLLPDYAQLNQNTYRYRIRGFDESWSAWTHDNVINITDLPSGEYKLEVEARNFMNIKTPEPLSRALIIHPPWYASLPAIIFYIAGGGFFMFTAARRYSNYRTEQHYMQMKAEQAEELAKLDRMKTNFLTNISHELRTPLSLLIGPVRQLMEQEEDIPEGWKQRLRVAQRNGLRLRELVEQVLDLTRLDAQQMNLKIKPTDLDYLLHLLCESFESMAKQNNSKLSYQRTTGIKPLYVDRDKIEKVLTNLISNAIRHTKNASVTLELFDLNDSEITINVSDTGEGIPEEKLPYIFKRFHTNTEDHTSGVGGIGVGLAITKEFVELHKGSIEVDSTEGEGTRFTITLRKGIEHLPDSAIIDHEANPRTGSELFEDIDIDPLKQPLLNAGDETKPALLVVEDNHDMQFYIRDVLGDQVTIHTADNGEEGRKMMSIHKPDLIITDIMMPEMDGFEFAAWVKSQSEHMFTPIIVLSARAELEDRIKGFSIGVQDYLIKPFNPQELRVRVGNLLNFKRERDRFEEREETVELSADQQLLEDLKTYIQNHLDEEISVEQLADAGTMSRRQLYRKLKSLTGFTPAQFIREIRLQHALQLLQQHKAGTISEIAYSVGFSTPGYFSRLFKERFGSSPGEYL